MFSYKHQRIHWCEAACLWHEPSKSQHAIRYLKTYTRACIHKVIHPAIRQDHFRQPQDIAIEVQLGSTLREMQVIQKRCIQAFAVLLWQFHGLRRDFIPNINTNYNMEQEQALFVGISSTFFSVLTQEMLTITPVLKTLRHKVLSCFQT